MSDFHNKDLRLLASRCSANIMKGEDAFVQGFMMGRNYEREFNSQLHNSILREMRQNESVKYTDDNWWNNRITELETELFSLKSKYVWTEEP